MPKKRKTLPKNFNELINAGDIAALKEVFEQCEWNARGGFSKETAIGFYSIPDELVGWLVEQGADINAPDKHQHTPLHRHAGIGAKNIRLLLELGANIEAVDSDLDTPLHAAAMWHKPQVVRELVRHGANVHALNDRKYTPLALALARCRNSDIVNTAEIAEILLHAGTPVTPDMLESVQRIGKDFEFHKERFNKESVDETASALLHLYEKFDVVPVQKRQMHDGISPITVRAADWADRHEELWDYLIPSQGYAKTVQGEVIRITGRVSHEIMGNGGVNWDNDYRKMLSALLQHFAAGTPLAAAELHEAEALVKSLQYGAGNDEPARLCELAVQWVLANPDPVGLQQPDYRR